jgi:DNA-binding MarR family transcriptional regulator
MYSWGVTETPPTAELVTYAARLVRVVSRAAANESPAALRLLSQLDELGEISVTELARADRTTQPTTSAGVRALEEKGWVARVAHPDDARSTLLTLTDSGRAELAAARRRHGAVVEDLAAQHAIDPAAIAAAVAVLRALTTSEQP